MADFKCCKCGEIKPLDAFGRCKPRKGGRDPRCKVCASNHLRNYYRLKRGVANKIHQAQRCNSKTRGHPPPAYSLEELRNWLFKNPKFNSIYKSWVDSGYMKNKAPSCDRIDNSKPYTFDNIQLVTWGQNFKNWIDSDELQERCGKIAESTCQ